ncbi:pre-toxin TG domain-containing protein [Tepidibacillus sp. LV47]|uniref:pre-toxin TG domain-containing protein n=1 Tax=Tepidibacillus sp. LV47 TaxID=3398228 RepID=UPI003AAAE742
MRSSHFRSLAGIRPLYGYESNVSVQNRYIFHQTKTSGYGFDFKAGYSLKKLPKWKKFRLPSSSFKRQAGSMALDFIPVVGNIKGGIEAISGRDLVTGRKLSVTDRLMAGVGVFTGGGGKALLKGIKFGFKFAKTPKLGISRKGTSDVAHNAVQYAKLKTHYKQWEKYGKDGMRELPDGRIRYYGEVKPAKKLGEMAGRRVVREWNPVTDQKRTWHETVDDNGRIRQVRPDTKFTGGVKIHYLFDKNRNYIGKR